MSTTSNPERSPGDTLWAVPPPGSPVGVKCLVHSPPWTAAASCSLQAPDLPGSALLWENV